MSIYANVMFLHLAAMAILFIGYGLEWIGTAFLRRATTAQAAQTWLGAYRISLPMSGPALLVLILTGGYLGAMTGASKEGWVLASVVGILVALGIGFGVIMPRMKRIKAALPTGEVALTGEALEGVQDGVIVTLIRIRACIAMGIVYVMTTKPSLVTSFAILFGFIVLGILFSASVWSRPKANQAA